MVRGVEGNEMSTPRPSQKKQPPSSSQSAKGQKSILGFFQKKSTNSPSPAPSQSTPAKQTPTPTLAKKSFSRPPPALTPVASSDAPEPSSPVRQEEEDTPVAAGRNKENGLPSRVSTPGTETDRVASEVAGVALSSPSRKVSRQYGLKHVLKLTNTQGRKADNYAESDEDEDDVLGPIANNSRARAMKRRRVSVDDDSDDEFGLDAATQAAMVEDGTS
jgi:DNA mismatch repair protein MSH6